MPKNTYVRQVKCPVCGEVGSLKYHVGRCWAVRHLPAHGFPEVVYHYVSKKLFPWFYEKVKKQMQSEVIATLHNGGKQTC